MKQATVGEIFSLLTQQVLKPPKPWCLMLIGLPGSGKSTFTQNLEMLGAQFKVLSTDAFVEAWAEERGLTYAEAHKQMPHKLPKQLMAEAANKAIAIESSVIIDQTNMGMKSRRGKLDKFIKAGYHIYALTFEVPREQLDERLLQRGKATNKWIPVHVVDDMLKSYQSPSKEEGFAWIKELRQ